VAFGVSIAAGLVAWMKIRQGYGAVDFAFFWVAGRALLGGGDPYTAVHPGVLHFDNWFMYPLPVAMVGALFAGVTLWVGDVLFVGASFGLLAFLLTRGGWHRLTILMSAPAIWCMTNGQWTPLVLAGALSPAFAWGALGKPTLGLAAFAYRPSWRFIVVAGVAFGVSLLVMPTWPLRWWETTRKAPPANYYSPILQPFGWLLALSALRWRTPEGRLLLVLSCVPQSMLVYDQFPLLLLARTRVQSILFTLWTLVVPLSVAFLTIPPSLNGRDQTYPFWARSLTLTLYLPALAIVLWPQARSMKTPP
jgi:hypothetical protein